MENNPLLDISQISGKRGNKRLEEMQNFRLDCIWQEILQLHRLIDKTF